MYLHAVQSHSSASDFFRLVWWPARSWAPVTDLRGSRIYPLLVGRKLQLHLDRLDLVPAAKPSLFNPVRPGRVCLLTRWNVHEDEGKTFCTLGRHWRPGKWSSAFDTRPHFLWHIFEALSMKRVIIQNNRRTVLKRRITVKQIVAFLCFLKNKDFFKSEELPSSVFTDTQFPPFTEGTDLDL